MNQRNTQRQNTSAAVPATASTGIKHRPSELHAPRKLLTMTSPLFCLKIRNDTTSIHDWGC